jgi:hypothetical protein
MHAAARLPADGRNEKGDASKAQAFEVEQPLPASATTPSSISPVSFRPGSGIA